jgi:hypothetical protein
MSKHPILLSTTSRVPVATTWYDLQLRMEGNCEYIEQAVAESREGVVLQFDGFVERLKISLHKIHIVTV